MQNFDHIPEVAPKTPLLDLIEFPAQLRAMTQQQLLELADQLRAFLLYSVGNTGGHLGAGLGVVELTLALHYIFNTPEDRIVWDVGHQSYPHKILTGRRALMKSLRQPDGLASFPDRSESEYDVFGVGHSSTSISAALGMALAQRHGSPKRKVIAVIGDGGITSGMAYEAMAHAGDSKPNMLIVLNDNQMSISNNIGGLHNYLTRIWSSKLYAAFRRGSKKILKRMPTAWEIARRTEAHTKGMITPGMLFEELGLNYYGPIDGHDLPLLLNTLKNLHDNDGTQFLHILTVKGKGYVPAEQSPIHYHAIGKIDNKKDVQLNQQQHKTSKSAPKLPKYQDIFGQWLCHNAAQHKDLIGITPAMCEGSGMVEFREKYPEQFYDVAISEQHALTFAAGLACENLKPIVAIYSTFLQRGYDQLIHDIALQNLNILFAIDRAGLVGEDSPTHAGVFDIGYLRCIPQMIIATPSDAIELANVLETGFHHQGPFAVRYPRGETSTKPPANYLDHLKKVPIGRSVVTRPGKHTALLVFGPLLKASMEIAERYNYTVVDMRFVKPMDTQRIIELTQTHQRLCSIEDHALMCGAGDAISQILHQHNIATPLVCLGVPDHFIAHASRGQQLAKCGLDAAGIEKALVKNNN